MAKRNFSITDKSLDNEIIEFCKLNNIEDVEKFKTNCFKTGFDIERYGLLGDNSGKIGEVQEKRVEIEVIREKRVEVPVEVEKIVEKIVEKPVIVEKIIQQPIEIEKIVEKIVYISNDEESKTLTLKIQSLEDQVGKGENKNKLLSDTLFNLKTQLEQKDKKINELENKINELSGALSAKFATYHPNSNLKSKL